MANARKFIYMKRTGREPNSKGLKFYYLRFSQDPPGPPPMGEATSDGRTCGINVEDTLAPGADDKGAGLAKILDDTLADGRGLALLDGRGCLTTVDTVVGTGLDCEAGRSITTGAETEGAADAAALTDKELGIGWIGAGALEATTGATLFDGSTGAPPATKMSFWAPGKNPTSALYPGLLASLGTGTLSPSA
jgi:hypothetical protein